ncbi:MAG: hypothetical protein A3H96_27295 [Acidobacteria bacterium RIFCSPLOWO2_02_FULL_67_36]|nr:MAG: hypothetical protein A3H96_27295 [Acidobacteria bacterium RIFCSPLOWO2_02_FULL_67_36]OFW24571.1 MAG: hypothetical protein A3G21_18640 [Acidobacteria bacterium RIFCSPLOWO2_12_FULL_66_21]
MALVIALLGTAAVVGAGMFFTFRGFRAANRPPVEVKPAHAKNNPHDAAMTAELKHFFEGKQCSACSRPIPPVHAFELRPGLLNADTREAIAWVEIPAANLSTTLESHVPICSNCLVIETFRRQHPDLVVDRHRTIENPSN